MLPHQSRPVPRSPLRPQLWPCCCRCVWSSSSSCSWGGGGEGSSSPEEDARSSPVDPVRRKITGIWARAGLVSCRPWIHLASVAWSWAPAIHMAKTGPSSTVGRDRPSVCAGGTVAHTPSRPRAGTGSSLLVFLCIQVSAQDMHSASTAHPMFHLCDASWFFKIPPESPPASHLLLPRI